MNRKKIISILLISLLSVGLLSCGEEKTSASNSESTSNSTTNEKNTKKEYQDKLDNIEKGLSDLEKLYAGNTIEMNSAAEEEGKRWDKALNEIYNELKTQLSKDEMSSLETEEAQWIKDRDKSAKDASLKYEGGTAENLEYNATLAKITKERCYELVNKYMK